MLISGWGNSQFIDANINQLQSSESLIKRGQSDLGRENIARGAGRSYGDSALASSVIETINYDHFISFDKKDGILRCTAGITLEQILEYFVPLGWFLPVTPGTKYVTVGGAIASDVHGKNHHKDGCFSNYVDSFNIYTASDGVVKCSSRMNAELFRATCGGMGLTGVILDATIKLLPISSSLIDMRLEVCPNIECLLSQFDQYSSFKYSVAWIDCLSRGQKLGRSILMVGDHLSSPNQSKIKEKRVNKITLPFNLPNWLLNPFTVNAFNQLYYYKHFFAATHTITNFNNFFYPLDNINGWNKMYGTKGFLQYQFVLPKESGIKGLQAILKIIAESQEGSFLAVLKEFGPENNNLLSFPKTGYTLALDFKYTAKVLQLLEKLDDILIEHGGRVYLTKDSRLSQRTFKIMYPNWISFCQIRERYGAQKIFNSLQSRRLGL